jgi:hypothetical protein
MTRALLTLTCWLAAVWTAQALDVSIPEYRTGDVVGSDITAPFEFAVVNPAQTERLREQELKKIPAVYRYNPRVGVEAEERFGRTFSRTRVLFLESMEQAAGRRALDDAIIAHPSFWRFVDWFTARHPDFPLTTNLAKAWAREDDNDAVQVTLQSALRETMARYIRPPVDDGPPELQIVTADSTTTRLTLADLVGASRTVESSATLTLPEAREDVVRRCGAIDPELGAFIATFVRENLSLDDWLTAQKRQHRAAELVVFDQYSPGQLVARTGQLVDARTKAALDVLAAAAKRQQVRAHAEPAAEADQLGGRVLALWADVQNATRQHPALIAIVATLVVVVLWRLLTNRTASVPPPASEAYTVVMNPSRNETVFLPAGTSAETTSFASPSVTLIEGGATGTPWQMQLREAEQRAEELLALVRAGLAPHLARELTHKLVQELVCQRATLLRAHQLAEQEIVALEKRFEKVYRELQQRVEVSEKRTSDLEKELAAKGEQTRELMKATILLTQQKLDTKKAGDEFACN